MKLEQHLKDYREKEKDLPTYEELLIYAQEYHEEIEHLKEKIKILEKFA